MKKTCRSFQTFDAKMVYKKHQKTSLSSIFYYLEACIMTLSASKVYDAMNVLTRLICQSRVKLIKSKLSSEIVP